MDVLEDAMRFMLMFKSEREPAAGETACKQELPEMARVMEELRREGILLSTEGLLPAERGARVKYAGGKLAVRDGPFAEAKELIAGFAIVNVKSRAEAVEIAKRFLAIAGEGGAEVREVMEVGN